MKKKVKDIMKYVRTKEGIYEIENSYEHLGKTYYGIKGRISTFAEEEVIDQADTIEELLDGFIIVDRKNPKNWFTTDVEEVMNEPKDELLRMMNYWEYHGYVQTKKGMQYVADFDEKGELCLLNG